MRLIPRVRSALTITGLILAGVLLTSHAIAGPGGGGPPGGSNRTFEITGGVEGLLYPQIQRELILKIENPYGFDILVTGLSVQVDDPSPTCSAGFLQVGELTGVPTIPAGEDLVVTLPATLAGEAPDACQLAAFPLTYRATAVRA